MYDVIQISCLGEFGRWGNQLFQFCFAKSYAEKYNCELQIPENWIGRRIFKNIDKIPTIKYPLKKTKLDLIPFGEKNIDLFGYFQFEEAFDLLSLSKIRQWLQFKDEFIELFPKQLDYYVACHVRKQDYISKFSHIYCNIAEISYIKSVKAYGYEVNKIFWVSDDYPQTNIKCEFDFLQDFFTLMNADVLFRSNSTFGVWASILGNAITYAPLVEDKVGYHEDINFIHGNYPRWTSNHCSASIQKPCDFIFGRA